MRLKIEAGQSPLEKEENERLAAASELLIKIEEELDPRDFTLYEIRQEFGVKGKKGFFMKDLEMLKEYGLVTDHPEKKEHYTITSKGNELYENNLYKKGGVDI